MASVLCCSGTLMGVGALMGVGDRGCALMRAQTCALHHISIIGGQTARPIGAQIVGTNTYWDNGQTLWGSALASAHTAPPIRHWRPKGWTDWTPHWYKMAQVMVVGVRVAVQPSRASARTNARVQGWNRASQSSQARVWEFFSNPDWHGF
jgi:hypothetical protein